MASDWEKQQSQAIKDRQTRLDSYVTSNVQRTTDPRDPNMYAPPTQGTDPRTGALLPTGLYANPNIMSDASSARAAQTQEWLKDPKKYVQTHGTTLVNEQSLLDKGKSMMSRIFDYRDSADLQMFGMNVSAVESVWDGFLSHFTGAYDLLNIGFGGLLSAAPGGLRTLSYDELSGGKSVGQVLNGEMVPGSAPSPGQIAVTSIGIEAKRIREGGARLSDVLLLSPVTAPFILAGLAADTSPLQADNFDIMNKEQRDKAFSTGWEQWMTGVTDFGLSFADPLIAAGAGAKMVRNGALGLAGPARTVALTEKASELGLEELATLNNLPVDHFLVQGKNVMDLFLPENLAAHNAGKPLDSIPAAPRVADDQVIPGLLDGTLPTVAPVPAYALAENPLKTDLPKTASPMARVIHMLTRTDADGKPYYSYQDLMNMPELKAFSRTPELVDVLQRNKSPLIAKLIIDKAMGSQTAAENLRKLAPATADLVLRSRIADLRLKSRYLEDAKLQEAVGFAEETAKNVMLAIDTLTETINKLNPIADEQKLIGLNTLRNNYRQTVLDSMELTDMIKSGRAPDKMLQGSIGYNSNHADRVMANIINQDDVVAKALRDEIQGAGVQARFTVPTTNNAYSRMVSRSREKRMVAASQFAQEGTSIFPRKVITAAEATVKMVDGKEVVVNQGTETTERTGWFSKSELFENVGGFKRNIRVWRWAGGEVPSGYVGTKGMNKIGSEREVAATTNLDMYKNEPVMVTRNIIDKDGKVTKKTELVGGRAQREQMTAMWANAMNDDLIDPQKVLTDIEEMIQEDFQKIYGFNKTDMDMAMMKANQNRSSVLDVIKKKSYYTDPDDSTQHMVPHLTSMLENGTYMHNWQALERRLNSMKRGNDNVFYKGGERLVDTSINLYEVFNDVWRPMTLLRLSYTQRNVFEGMIRAMAYNASLAPMSWPVRASYNGIYNKVITRVVDKHVSAASSLVDKSMYAQLRDAHSQAILNKEQISNTLYLDSPQKGLEAGWYEWVKKPNEQGFYKKVPDATHEARLEKAHKDVLETEDALKANLGEYEKTIAGTKFGEWRVKQLADLDEMLKQHDTRIDWVKSLLLGPDAASADIYNKFGDELGELGALRANLELEKKQLMYDPQVGMTMYRGQAARQRRIGSGMSMGPDGNYYNDAYAGPLEQINRRLMSADNTYKQTLSLSSNVMGSIFREQSIKLNRPVAWDAADPTQWIDGMAETIETASSNPLVQEMVRNGWNVEKTMAWAMDPKNRHWLNLLTTLQGSTPTSIKTLKEASDVYKIETKKTLPPVEGTEGFRFQGKTKERFAKVTEVVNLPTGGKQAVVVDRVALQAHIAEVSNIIHRQMQVGSGDRTFMNLLEQRVAQKQGSTRVIRRVTGENVGATTSTGRSVIDPKSISNAINAMPEEARARLGYIQGSEIVDMGNPKYLMQWAKLANWMFTRLGTIPEDAVTRGPFYNTRYKATRNDLIAIWMQNNGQGHLIGKGKTKAASGKLEDGTMSHEAFQIPAKEIYRIETQAHARALQDTREWMYTIERRTNLGKYGEWVSPFISAQQNTMVVAGKLLYKQPWLAPFVADLWRAPSRLGFEDEQGNLHIVMPLPWVRDFLKDHPEIPFLGGVVDSNDMITIPKDGINVFLPESGFGLAPRPSPIIQVAASELMKKGLFSVETPALLVSFMGKEKADETYTMLKDYIFGEGQGMSSKALSWDKVLPAYLQKAVYSADAMSQQYGSTFALQLHTQYARFLAKERDDMPTEAEIHKRATNSFWFNLLGNLGVPTPLTPYPVLTRPVVESPVQILVDRFKMYQEVDKLNPDQPPMANYNFAKDYGDWALQMANTKITGNVGGADPTTAAVSDAQTFSNLIANSIGAIGDQKDVLGIIVNNRSDNTGYEQNAYEWQKTMNIPGSSDKWREVLSPEEAIAERQRTAGWVKYRAFMDQLDARLASAGLSNYQVAAAAPLKAAKDQFVRNMSLNADYGGWWTDYTDGAVPRTNSAVRVLELATSDETFRTELTKSGKTNLLGAMDEYVYYRRILMNELDQRGTTLANKDNADLLYYWDSIRQRLKTSDPRMAEIINTYLTADDNPAYVGSYSAVFGGN